jgi:hypothetical protein
MPRHFQTASVLALVLSGCPGSSPIEEDAGETGIEGVGDGDTSGADTESICNLAECELDCQRELSDCGLAMTGHCVAEFCECTEAMPCPPPEPCVPEDCGPLELCWDEFGDCAFACYTTIPLVIDPPGSCQMLLPDYPLWVVDYAGILFDGMELSYLDDCAEEIGLAWTWLPDYAGALLCEQACLEHENVVAEFVLGCPPD